jgi:hypothetical protein
MAVFWVLAPCSLVEVYQSFRGPCCIHHQGHEYLIHDQGDELPIALMMEAAKISEPMLNFYQTTRCYNPEDSNLHTHRRENLKSYNEVIDLILIVYCLYGNKEGNVHRAIAAQT